LLTNPKRKYQFIKNSKAPQRELYLVFIIQFSSESFHHYLDRSDYLQHIWMYLSPRKVDIITAKPDINTPMEIKLPMKTRMLHSDGWEPSNSSEGGRYCLRYRLTTADGTPLKIRSKSAQNPLKIRSKSAQNNFNRVVT